MSASKEKYDWIDDPFNEESQQQKRGLSLRSKAAIGGGCLLTVIALVILVYMFLIELSKVLA